MIELFIDLTWGKIFVALIYHIFLWESGRIYSIWTLDGKMNLLSYYMLLILTTLSYIDLMVSRKKIREVQND